MKTPIPSPRLAAALEKAVRPIDAAFQGYASATNTYYPHEAWMLEGAIGDAEKAGKPYLLVKTEAGHEIYFKTTQ